VEQLGLAMPATMLTCWTQNDYNNAAIAAKATSNDDINGFITLARDLLDTKGQPEWLEWVGEVLMPQAICRKKEAEEREEQEWVQCEVEERATSYKLQHTVVEDSFTTGAITAKQFKQELAEIYTEEDMPNAEGDGGPPPSKYEGDMKGDDKSDLDIKGDEGDTKHAREKPNDNQPTTNDPTSDESSNNKSEESSTANDKGKSEIGDTYEEVIVNKAMIIVPGRQVVKCRDCNEEAKMHEVMGQVSPLLNISPSKLTTQQCDCCQVFKIPVDCIVRPDDAH